MPYSQVSPIGIIFSVNQHFRGSRDVANVQIGIAKANASAHDLPCPTTWKGLPFKKNMVFFIKLLSKLHCLVQLCFRQFLLNNIKMMFSYLIT